VYVLSAVVAVVVLGAIGLVLWVRIRRRRRGQAVSQEETRPTQIPRMTRSSLLSSPDQRSPSVGPGNN
jgi:hypothetical protein